MPSHVLATAKHCVLDWLGVTLAGSREPVARVVFERVALAERGDEATLLGYGRRATILSAALVHGTASHALDYDDTHWGLQGHPTAPVLGAIWSLAERENVSGATLLGALVAGIEVECRLGTWLNPSHYARGFHASATLGCFGAAAGAAHLLDLDELGWLHAFGLAGMQAAGLKSAFGSMAKPFQVGRAAQGGLLSALLAQGGLTANPHVLETDQGFVATHADGDLESSTMARDADRFLICDTLFKYHAACYLTHASIDGVRALLRTHDLKPSAIERIELRVDPTCFGVCNIERPRSGLEGKFSLRATAAMALLGDDTASPSAFNDARMGSPELLGWIERIDVVGETQPATRSTVRMRLRDGAEVAITLDSGVPATDIEGQGERLARKFDRLAALGPAMRAAVRERVSVLETLPSVRELTGLLACAG
jgi:2-methylcitrate dehydratase PrpD